ncbi:3-hydroxyacyl-CoA dehydrogenase NAD-binding domain-containing protein [Aurantiacibacter poecillastricola]|uniref:3-hydroxyacyl-CoA dehydrogenase NAD-binding domain-containing protein n=1 Tax=Aurantiacibacter poecillastricola TaxID=3064385 RepID=UPI00273D6D66|nr:3-hydroxyacyl-CoA dehydrogenase NAD-binding domain-containing protein [Aurantiacibacter sp. 219JJ12-13]MDP5261339.1 3-hydroxyacyl-CoA dehydrogenase NAD-binding domain-containing protein [Aurantiacibacter sp. 219JJ12-13]
MSKVTTSREDDVLVVTLDNPPVNAFSTEVRNAMAEAVEEAAGDDAIRAVVIRAEGRMFSGGADITEFGKPPARPTLPELIDSIENLAKPVVIALNGTALGGGCEIALGCNYRIAVPAAKIGLPEVKIGILPGAGGTQRLPRVVGVEEALPIIVTGNPISAKKAEAIGLIDRIVEPEKLREEAIAFAREVAGKDDHPISSQRTDRINDHDPGVFDAFREKHGRRLKGLEAPQKCIEAVKLATEVPYEEGIAKEREFFMELVMGDQSKALRHVFFAERQAGKIDGLPKDVNPLPVRKVGIIGAGTMGGGIAMNFLSAGYDVTMVEREQEALDRGLSIIRKNYEATARKGRMTPEQVEGAMGHLTTSLDYQDFADCDLVIEAVFELMDIKKDVFGKLDEICKPDAIMASNTSYLDINEIAASTSRPEQVVGLHFFSPANIMRLLEVVRGDKTSPQVMATAMDLAKKIGKVAVVSGVCHGFIGNRMLAARQEQANALLMEGALPAQVDQVLLDFGFPMGPFQMADLAGLDLGWKAEESSSSTIREVLCERGRRGQKTGKGFYDYDENRKRSSSDEVNAVIREFAEKSGKEQRDISDEEIRERLLYPMVNEGALILEEGIAQRASDIDTVWVNGYGWPPYTGGPMFWADTIGLDTVLAGLERHGIEPSQMLRDKAAKGETFNG